MNTSHLIRKGHRWYVRLMVPVQQRAAVGKTKLTRSLQTGDLALANRRKHAVLAELHEELAALIATPAPTPSVITPARVLATARAERAAIEAGEVDPEQSDAGLDALTDDFLDQQARAYGRDPEGRPKLPESELRVIRAAHRIHRGEPVAFLSEVIDEYLAEQARTLRPSTVHEKRGVLEKLAAWLGPGIEVGDITRKRAGEYVTRVLRGAVKERGGKAGELKSVRTIRDDVAHLGAFFNWLVKRGQLESNPFAGMTATVVASKRGSESGKRPFSPAELLRIFQGLPTGDPMWPLCALAAYTGMRREEVTLLRVSDVEGDTLRVRQGKTVAAVRSVPIHPVIAGLVASLVANTDDGFLIPGLRTGGADAKRGHLIGSRFSYALRRPPLSIEDPRADFHSFRRSFMTACEEAEVPESTVKLLVGHERQSLTYGGYSGDVSDAVKAKAVATVSYGKEVDQLVRKVGRKVAVTVRAKPRPSARKRG